MKLGTTIRFNLFVKLASFYILTHAVALVAASRLLNNPDFQIGFSSGSFVDEKNFWTVLIIWFVFSFLILYLLTRFHRASALSYKVFLTLILLSGSEIILFAFGVPFPILFAVILVILFWQRHSLLTHNSVVLVGIAGIATLLGLSFSPISAAFLLIIFSFYDVIAVYVTRHMIRLANMMIRAHAIFGFVIPFNETLRQMPVRNVRAGQNVMILGSGDVLLPLILVIARLQSSPPAAVVISLFSVFGLFVMQLIFEKQKTHRPMAALPPIALFALFGYFISLIF